MSYLNRAQTLVNEVCSDLEQTEKEYQVSEDPFSNFRVIAASLGQTDLQIGMVYLMKHIFGIANYIKNPQNKQRDDFRGRIKDAIAYLILLEGMWNESRPSVESNRK